MDPAHDEPLYRRCWSEDVGIWVYVPAVESEELRAARLQLRILRTRVDCGELLRPENTTDGDW